MQCSMRLTRIILFRHRQRLSYYLTSANQFCNNKLCGRTRARGEQELKFRQKIYVLSGTVEMMSVFSHDFRCFQFDSRRPWLVNFLI